MNALKDNIWKYQALAFLSWFLLIMPILVLFYQENGLSLTQILLIQSAFALTIVFCEIPSGYFADRYGRKKSIVIGAILATLGIWIYAFSSDFYSFLVAEIIMGVGSSFISGADTALIYDTLLTLKKTDQFKSIEGKRQTIQSFSEGSAAIFGGLLAVISLRTPIVANAAILSLSIPIVLSLKEPPRAKNLRQKSHLQHITELTKYLGQDYSGLRWLITYAGVLGSGTLLITWLYQPYMKLVGLPLAYFGVAWAILNVSVGIFSHRAEWIENKLGKRTALAIFPALFISATILLFLFPRIEILIILLIIQFIRGISSPLISAYINNRTDSENRATILSAKNFFGRLIFAGLAPAIGRVADIFSLTTAILLWGAIVFTGAIVSILFLIKRKVI